MSIVGNVEKNGIIGKIYKLVIDKTLSISGACADAAATGAAVEKLQKGIDDFETLQTQLIQDVVDVHANNKDNPHAVTTEQIGAVKKSGDTMTGDLTIRSTANYPGIHIDKGSTTKAGFQFAGQGVFITAEAVKNGTNSKRQLYLRNIGNQGNIKNSLALVNILTPEGGETTTATTLIYGEHNPQPTTFVGSYVGTGETPLTLEFANTPKRWGILGYLYTENSNVANNAFRSYLSLGSQSEISDLHSLPWGVNVLIKELSSGETSYGNILVEYSENTVSLSRIWGNDITETPVLNGVGTTYYYYAEY